MSISRPSLAIAGVAGFALLAGIVVHLTSVAPPLSRDFALAPASVGESGTGASVADSLEPEVSGAQATDETNAREAVQAAARATDERTLARLAEGGSELRLERHVLRHGKARPNAAAAGGDRRKSGGRARAESIVVTQAAPPAAFSGSEERASYAASGADSAASPAHFREQGRDQFAEFDSNPVKVAAEEPVSTFSIDVDTASYGFVRASLNAGVLPHKDAVRVEELVNYFPYDYPGPESRETPFAASVSLLPAPWNPVARLMHIGIKGYALDTGAAPRANLVFLIDVSGSMDEPNKLPLVVNSLKLLLGTLAPEDTVAIVVYAGAAGTVLPPTPARERGADPRRPRTPGRGRIDGRR